MPQPVSYNPGTPVSGSIQENSISYVVDGQNRNYRGGFGGLSWMSEVPAENNVIFIGNSTSLGRGPANIPLFYPAYNNSSANIVYAANTLPGSPRNFTTTGSAYNWAVTNNFFINNSNNPIPRIDADGLVLYVDANQPSSYPQTGTSWYDLSGKGTNGTLQNGVSWIASSGSFFFDGTDDYVSLGNLGTIGDNQTIEIWFNSNSVTSYKNVLDMNYSTYSPNTGNVGPRLEQTSGAGINWIWSGNTTNNNIYNFTPQISISSNKWYHTVFTLNSGNYNWYLNGNLEYSGTSPQGYVTTYGDVNLGRGFVLDPARYFSGLESSARIYSRTLSTSDVKQNYFQSNIVQDGLIFMVDANNLVSYPKSGGTWYNLTGSAGNATLTNGPTFSQENGGAIVYDGVDDYVGVSSFNVPYLTVSTWVYKTSTSTNQGISRKQNGWAISQYNGTLQVAVGPAWYFLDTGYTIPLNTWTNIVYTYSGTNQAGSQTVYINGVAIFSATDGSGAISPVSSTVWIGYDDNNWFWGGKIASNQIYNRALTATEVQQNYQATKDKFQGQQIVTNGLIVNLDSANKDSYSGTGITWYDLSGNANNGTLLNGVAFNANKNGGVMYFDDTDDTVSIGNSSLFSITNAMTVFAWVNPSSTSGWDGIFGGSISGFVHFQLYLGTINIYIYGPNASYSNNDSYNVPANAWISIGFTYDGTTLKVYVNGSQLATTIAGSGNVSSNSDVRVGWAYDTSRVFGGYIGTTQVYNRALSATEITQNYNATKVRFGL